MGRSKPGLTGGGIIQPAPERETAEAALRGELAGLSGRALLERVEQLRALLHSLSPLKGQPVDGVRWVPLEKVTPNDYNPNSVASVEMRLLYTSIHHDGYTQPCVTIWDGEKGLWVIVDGFHRYYTMKTNKDIYDACLGLLPIVVLNKGVNDRMASTVRHNRARGKHSVKGMSSMVFEMLGNGWDDAAICNHLGMSPEELLRLKHITGFSKLFQDAEYQRAWTTRRQILIAKQAREGDK
jgi:ParB-like chromosome segregation protein Spo0J